MRYSQDHRSATKAKIVTAASRSMRSKGPDGIAVAAVMAEVGLTHGGFYAHFRSREALLVSALESAFEEARLRFLNAGEGRSRRRHIEDFVDYYISAAHRDSPESGCPLVAFGSDIPRQGPALRAAYDRGFQGMVRGLARMLSAPTQQEGEGLAASILAEMAGTVMLSRAVADPEISNQILQRARKSVKARLLSSMGSDQ